MDLSPGSVKALGSIANNLLNGNIPLSKAKSLLINKHRQHLLTLSKGSLVNKKRVLQQKGGSVFSILSGIIPAIIGSIANAIG